MAKQVTDRQGATELVASAAETNADRIGSAFNEVLAPFRTKADKTQVPDMAYACRLAARRLRDASTRLSKASDAHDMELADDVAPRAVRDDATATLTAEVVEIRGMIEKVYGPGILSSLELNGRTPTEPKAILAQAKKLARYLADPTFSWPKPKRKGIRVEPSVWAADLQGPMDNLSRALVDVARETREAQVTIEEKARAMADHDNVYSQTVTFLSALFELVGDDVLAAKVRPLKRRPGTSGPREESSFTDAPQDGENLDK